MAEDRRVDQLRYELRGGPLDGTVFEYSQVTMKLIADSDDPYPEAGIWPLMGENGKTLGHRYDRTDEYTTNNLRVYRYAGVVALPFEQANK